VILLSIYCWVWLGRITILVIKQHSATLWARLLRHLSRLTSKWHHNHNMVLYIVCSKDRWITASVKEPVLTQGKLWRFCRTVFLKQSLLLALFVVCEYDVYCCDSDWVFCLWHASTLCKPFSISSRLFSPRCNHVILLRWQNSDSDCTKIGWHRKNTHFSTNVARRCYILRES